MPDRMQNPIRHAELVSASISPRRAKACGARWTLKQVQGDERWAWQKRIFWLPVLLVAISGCDAKTDWKGWVYPDRNNLADDVPIGAYSTLEECRTSARNILNRLKMSSAERQVEGDYECGLKCKAEGGLDGINVCEKTER